MVDISMCGDNKCPSRGQCHRYLARPSMRQSYAGFIREGDRCEYFIPSEKADRTLAEVEEKREAPF